MPVMDSEENYHESLVFIKSINIYRWIFTIFGLSFPPPLSRKTLNPWIKRSIIVVYLMYCAILSVLVLYTVHMHNGVMRKIATVFNLDGITKTLSYVQNILLVSVQLIMVAKTFWNSKGLGDIIEMIDQVEYDMTSQCKRIFKSSLLKWKLLRISGISLVVLTVILIYLNYFLNDNTMSVQLRTSILFLIVAMQVKCIEYGVYIQLIYEFIDYLGQNLVQLKVDIEQVPQSSPHSSCSPWYLLQLMMKNQILLNRVLLLVSRVGQYFASPLLLIFFYNGEAILCTINWAYVRYIHDMRDMFLLFRFLYVLILLSNLLIVCCLTQRCIQKYRSIIGLIHIINISSNDCAMLMRLREYSMQIMHQNLVFTCDGYMDIDFRSYGKMLLVISSYVIILVQFKMGDADKGSMLATQLDFGKNYRSIIGLIHIINISSNDCAMLMRLREYSMQIMHQNLVFTCDGYMDIDFRSYGKMLLVISSYVIILVQFKMGDADKGSMLATQLDFGKNV